MKCLIIYASQYGTTKRYAENLSKRTEISMISYQEITDLSQYDTIIHLGALYAGGVKGLGKTVKALPNHASLMIATVGLADVNDQENTDPIKQAISSQVPKEILAKTKIFHLRGGIDYKKLNVKHKIMMKLLYNKAKNLPDEKKNAEVRVMLETYNQKIDFINYDYLNQMIESLR